MPGIGRSTRIVLAAAAALVPVAGVAALATRSEAARAPRAADVLLAKGLERPNGLAFNPADGSLWIVDNGNGRFDEIVVIRGLGRKAQKVESFIEPEYHYLAEPTGIAFSPARREVATSGLVGDGPTLWTSEQRLFTGSRSSHLDMVHHTETVAGIAAGADGVRREYWVVNGTRGSIDRYFFNEPHELGGMDHSDGVVYRYAEGSLKDVLGIPAHVAFDAASGRLFAADTANGRVVVLESGPEPVGAPEVIGPRWLPERLFRVEGSQVRTFASGLRRPSGLLLKRGDLLVGDHATGRIVVLTLDGRRVRTVDTGVGKNALTGLAADARGRVHFLDARRGRLLRLRAALP